MRIIKATPLALLILILLLPIDATSEFSEEPFDYTRTMAIYHMVEGGGHIYVRPREYYHLQGFIVIYEALDQYIVELENPDNKSFMKPGNEPVLDEFVLVNDVSQKSYLLKQYWLGDGEHWVPMSREDYDKLRGMIDDRHKAGSVSTPRNRLEIYTDKIHKRSALNDYSGYEWEGENVRQDRLWIEEPNTRENLDSETPPVDPSEEKTEEPVDTPRRKKTSTQDGKTEVDRTSDRKREEADASSNTEKRLPNQETLALKTIEPKDSNGIKQTQKKEQTGGRVWIWISILSILLLGGILYSRKKP